MPVSCHDVAKYILKRQGKMTAMKLQKLIYYCQAWTLVWAEEPLFPEEIQAWANGPVVPEIYQVHKGMFEVAEKDFKKAKALPDWCKKHVDKVLDFYGGKSAQWLSNLTHRERPWKETRGDTPIGEPSSAVITTALMHEYYSSL